MKNWAELDKSWDLDFKLPMWIGNYVTDNNGYMNETIISVIPVVVKQSCSSLVDIMFTLFSWKTSMVWSVRIGIYFSIFILWHQIKFRFAFKLISPFYPSSLGRRPGWGRSFCLDRQGKWFLDQSKDLYYFVFTGLSCV